MFHSPWPRKSSCHTLFCRWQDGRRFSPTCWSSELVRWSSQATAKGAEFLPLLPYWPKVAAYGSRQLAFGQLFLKSDAHEMYSCLALYRGSVTTSTKAGSPRLTTSSARRIAG